MTTRFALIASLAQTGWHMALFGLVLGGGSYLVTWRGSRPPTGPIARGQVRVWRATAIPLLVVGLIGLVFWLIGTLK